jgi:hypothetical protein
MPVLIPKPGVTFAQIAPAGGAILAAAGIVAMRMNRDLTITSATDSHPAEDPHTLGAALDFSVGGMSEAEILMLVTHFQDALGPKFTVLYEVPTKPNGVLASICYVNPKATGAHVHVQHTKQFAYTLQEAMAK